MLRLIIATALVFSFSANSGLPPTTLSGQSATTKPTTFNFKTPYNQATNTPTGGLIETGNTNVLVDPGLEASTTSWSAYADAAGTSPVDGTGGAPTVSVSNSTSSPISGSRSLVLVKDAANRQGEGISIPFTLDDSMKGKVVSLSFDYAVVSGTYATGDVTFWVYDVTNGGAPKQFDRYQLQSHTLISDRFTGEFQSSYNSSSYRLIAHVSTTSALAYTLKFDNFDLSVGKKTYGSPVTDDVTFTPTGSFSANSTYTGAYYREGAYAVIKYKIAFSGAPNATSLSLNLPSGLSIDSGKLLDGTSSKNLGRGKFRQGATGDTYEIGARYNSSTSVQIYPNTATGTYVYYNSVVTQAVPVTIASSDTLEIDIKVPISGWSSSVQMSDTADTRIVNARAYASTTQLIGIGATAKINLGTKSYDSHGGFDTTNSRYTAQSPGYYKFTGNLYYTSTTANSELMQLYKNGSPAMRIASTTVPVSGIIGVGYGTLYLNAGDYVELYVTNTSTATQTIDNGSGLYSYLEVEKTTGPSQIAASETVSASYWLSANFAASTTTPINFDSKEWDTHGSVTTSATAWKFTAPIAGEYTITVQQNITTSTSIIGAVYKNGVNIKPCVYSSSGAYSFGTCKIKLLATEYVDIRPGSSITYFGGTLSNSSSKVEITRTGNY